MIQLIDLNGNNIEVTDLDEAIRITEQYKDYRHANKGFEGFDRRQCSYWTDLHEKLINIRNNKSVSKSQI